MLNLQDMNPEGWRSVTLDAVTLPTAQIDPRRTDCKTFEYVDVSSVSNRLFKIISPNTIPCSEAPSRARKLIQTNDVLFATVRPTLRRIALVSPEHDGAIASTGFCVLRTNTAVADPKFIYYVALTDQFIDHIGAKERGATYPAVRDSDVRAQEVLLPPLSEQRHIAAVLELIQQAIMQQERLIGLYRELKRALLRKLMTEGLSGESLRETQLGPRPESWRVLALRECLLVAQYGLSTKSGESGIYPILRMTNQHEGKISSDNLKYVDLSTPEASRFLLQSGDVLFNRTNSIDLVGRTAIFDLEGEYVFASYLIRLRTDPTLLDPYFLNAYLNEDSAQRRLKTIATRSVSQSNISATRLGGFVIPLPSLHEQGRSVEILKAVDSKRVNCECKLKQLNVLFRSVLRQLMTAEVRVTDLDFSAVHPLVGV